MDHPGGDRDLPRARRGSERADAGALRGGAALRADAPLLCGARTKRGTGTCKQAAGARTDHPGQGKCWLHGGATPIKHGRYSLIQRPRLQELIARFGADANPLDTLPEIALTRGLLVDYIERYDAYTDALIAWHESWRDRNEPLSAEKEQALRAVLDEYQATVARGDDLSEQQADQLKLAREAVDALVAGPVKGKPHQVLDVADAYRMAGEVTKMVERIERARAANAVSVRELELLMLAMARVVEQHVPDAVARTRIRKGWDAIRL